MSPNQFRRWELSFLDMETTSPQLSKGYEFHSPRLAHESAKMELAPSTSFTVPSVDRAAKEVANTVYRSEPSGARGLQLRHRTQKCTRRDVHLIIGSSPVSDDTDGYGADVEDSPTALLHSFHDQGAHLDHTRPTQQESSLGCVPFDASVDQSYPDSTGSLARPRGDTVAVSTLPRLFKVPGTAEGDVHAAMESFEALDIQSSRPRALTGPISTSSPENVQQTVELTAPECLYRDESRIKCPSALTPECAPDTAQPAGGAFANGSYEVPFLASTVRRLMKSLNYKSEDSASPVQGGFPCLISGRPRGLDAPYISALDTSPSDLSVTLPPPPLSAPRYGKRSTYIAPKSSTTSSSASEGLFDWAMDTYLSTIAAGDGRGELYEPSSAYAASMTRRPSTHKGGSVQSSERSSPERSPLLQSVSTEEFNSTKERDRLIYHQDGMQFEMANRDVLSSVEDGNMQGNSGGRETSKTRLGLVSYTSNLANKGTLPVTVPELHAIELVPSRAVTSESGSCPSDKRAEADVGKAVLTKDRNRRGAMSGSPLASPLLWTIEALSKLRADSDKDPRPSPRKPKGGDKHKTPLPRAATAKGLRVFDTKASRSRIVSNPVLATNLSHLSSSSTPLSLPRTPSIRGSSLCPQPVNVNQKRKHRSVSQLMGLPSGFSFEQKAIPTRDDSRSAKAMAYMDTSVQPSCDFRAFGEHVVSFGYVLGNPSKDGMAAQVDKEAIKGDNRRETTAEVEVENNAYQTLPPSPSIYHTPLLDIDMGELDRHTRSRTVQRLLHECMQTSRQISSQLSSTTPQQSNEKGGTLFTFPSADADER